ncbi:molybdopterin synthase catalytic subunit MoaE [Thalassotalea fusca]
MQTTVEIQTANFDQSELYKELQQGNVADGAIVTFTGQVRQRNLGDDVVGLSLEHYPGMTEKTIADIVSLARQKWAIGKVIVIHRVGDLKVGENIVFVGVTGPHRGDCYAANEFIMDFLKIKAPFWKKEITTAGTRWLDAKSTDHKKAQQWEN